MAGIILQKELMVVEYNKISQNRDKIKKKIEQILIDQFINPQKKTGSVGIECNFAKAMILPF